MSQLLLLYVLLDSIAVLVKSALDMHAEVALCTNSALMAYFGKLSAASETANAAVMLLQAC